MRRRKTPSVSWCTFSRNDEFTTRQLFRALATLDFPRDDVVRRVMASDLDDGFEIFRVICPLEGLINLVDDPEIDTDPDLGGDFEDPERANAVLLARFESEARRRYPGNQEAMVKVIADNVISWGDDQLVGRAIGSSTSLSWTAKLALIRYIADDFRQESEDAFTVEFSSVCSKPCLSRFRTRRQGSCLPPFRR